MENIGNSKFRYKVITETITGYSGNINFKRTIIIPHVILMEK